MDPAPLSARLHSLPDDGAVGRLILREFLGEPGDYFIHYAPGGPILIGRLDPDSQAPLSDFTDVMAAVFPWAQH